MLSGLINAVDLLTYSSYLITFMSASSDTQRSSLECRSQTQSTVRMICESGLPSYSSIPSNTIQEKKMTESGFPIDVVRSDLQVIVEAMDAGVITSEGLVREYLGQCS